MLNIHSLLEELIYTLPAIAIALAFHEFAHAYVAYKLGDLSQKENGRLTLNPLKHLDPVGTLCLLLFKFGWAKPVQVDPYYFKNKKDGMIWSAIAGPLANLILGFVCVLLFLLLTILALNEVLFFSSSIGWYLVDLMWMSAIMNVGLAVFNLIPIPPLDGSKILMGLLPEETYFKLMRYEMYFSVLLLFLLYMRVLSEPLVHARTAILNVFYDLAFFILHIFI